MLSLRPALRGLLVAAILATGACAMPHVLGMGSYYEVTDTRTGKIYYSDRIEREDNGVVELRNGATKSWVSLPAATVREISEAEYEANVGK